MSLVTTGLGPDNNLLPGGTEKLRSNSPSETFFLTIFTSSVGITFSVSFGTSSYSLGTCSVWSTDSIFLSAPSGCFCSFDPDVSIT